MACGLKLEDFSTKQFASAYELYRLNPVRENVVPKYIFLNNGACPEKLTMPKLQTAMHNWLNFKKMPLSVHSK